MKLMSKIFLASVCLGGFSAMNYGMEQKSKEEGDMPEKSKFDVSVMRSSLEEEKPSPIFPHSSKETKIRAVNYNIENFSIPTINTEDMVSPLFLDYRPLADDIFDTPIFKFYFKQNCQAMETAIGKGVFNIDKGLPGIAYFLKECGSEELLEDIVIEHCVSALSLLITKNEQYKKIESEVLEKIKGNISSEERLQLKGEIGLIRQGLALSWVVEKSKNPLTLVPPTGDDAVDNLKILNANRHLPLEGNVKLLAAAGLVDSLALAQLAQEKPLEAIFAGPQQH